MTIYIVQFQVIARDDKLPLLTRIVHSALKTERPKFFDYVLSKGYDVQELDWKEIAKLYCEVKK